MQRHFCVYIIKMQVIFVMCHYIIIHFQSIFRRDFLPSFEMRQVSPFPIILYEVLFFFSFFFLFFVVISVAFVVRFEIVDDWNVSKAEKMDQTMKDEEPNGSCKAIFYVKTENKLWFEDETKMFSTSYELTFWSAQNNDAGEKVSDFFSSICA